MKQLLQLAFLFFSSVVFSQKIKGLISVFDVEIPKINIINLSKKTVTNTDEKNNFLISAKIGDTIFFTSLEINETIRIIKKEDIENEFLHIKLEKRITLLDEVQVNEYQRINAFALGIIANKKPKYTPAERRLKTAGDFKPWHLLGLLGGGIALDPILNAINGKTKRIKKEILIEKKEVGLKQIDNLFEDNYFIEVLKIEEEDIEGFKYFCVENEQILSALKAKNKTMVKFLLVQTAKDFLEKKQK